MIRQTRQRRRRGFTLLEVLLVVGILVALAAIALPNLIRTQEGAKIDEAKIQVNALSTAFDLYHVHNGTFPSSDQGLRALVEQVDASLTNWRGPYLKEAAALRDPWGLQYNYVYPGPRNTPGPDIWSNGPDRVSGSADDVGNWPTGT